MVAQLLKPKILSLKNSISLKVIMRRLPFIAIGIGFWVLFYVGTYKALSYLRGIELFGEMLSKKFFSMTFFSLLWFLILSNIITAISSFYLSKDIPMLLSKPIETRDILRLKTFESFLNSSWMVLSFIPPVFIAYGVSYGANLSYYVFVLAWFFVFSLITAGSGIIIAHILTRLFPAKKARNALLGIGIILFLMLYFAIKSVIPDDMSTPESFLNSLMSFKTESPLFPSYWIAESVWPMLNNSSPEIIYLIALVSNSSFFMVLAEISGLKFFRVNLDRIQPSGGRARSFLKGYYPETSTAIFYKDIKTFFRDTGQWSQVFIIGALVIVYIYNFRSIPLNSISGLTPFIKEIMVLINMVLSGLVLSAVAARFIYASVSLEGQAFWIIRTAPVEMKRFLWSKFLYGSNPVTILIMSVVFLTNLAMNIDMFLMLVSLSTVLLLSISVSGLGTGFGAVYPKFKHENIASVSMSLAGMVFMLIAFSVVLATLFLETWIFYMYNKGIGSGGLDLSEKMQIALYVILILSINVSAFYLPMKIGEKKLQRNAGII